MYGMMKQLIITNAYYVIKLCQIVHHVLVIVNVIHALTLNSLILTPHNVYFAMKV